MIYIDKYAYFNNLKDVHPVEKSFFSVVTLGVILIVNASCLTVFAA